MRSISLNFSFILLVTAVLAMGSLAQTPAGGARPSVAAGDVVSVSPAKIVLQTKDGNIDVPITDKTEFKKVPPDNPVLKAATPSTVGEIAEGDKLMVTGFFSDDKKTLPARSVYLMSKTEIADRHKKEAQEWATRGISGKVSKVDQMTKQISVEVRGLANTTAVVVSPKDGAKFLRYAPNSIKFSEAKTSNILEIQPGDMVRALGDRSADGVSFAAEEIVTGAFQTSAGTVKSIDATKNEVVITDMASKSDVTVDLSLATMLKRFPPEMAQRMAQFQGGGMRPGGGAPGAPGAGGRPQGTPPANGQAGPGGPGGPGRMGGRGGIDDMLERFPNITVADLKAGDVIAVSSSKNNTPGRITAIKLLAGVEPFIAAAAAQQAAGGRRQTQSLDIPGLDGISFP